MTTLPGTGGKRAKFKQKIAWDCVISSVSQLAKSENSMHELPIIKKVLHIVLSDASEQEAKEVRAVTLKVGEMHDLIPELVERYFSYVSRGTIAEKAKLKIISLPITCTCNDCQKHFIYNLRYVERTQGCPVCGGEDLDLLSGNELLIDNIEIC